MKDLDSMWDDVMYKNIQRAALAYRIKFNCDVTRKIPADMPLQNVNSSHEERESEERDEDEKREVDYVIEDDKIRISYIHDDIPDNAWALFYHNNDVFDGVIELSVEYPGPFDTDPINEDPVYKTLKWAGTCGNIRGIVSDLMKSLERRQMDETTYNALLDWTYTNESDFQERFNAIYKKFVDRRDSARHDRLAERSEKEAPEKTEAEEDV